MGNMNTHVVWFNTTTGGASGRAAALAAEIPVATLNRQLGRGEIDAGHVIAIARAYGQPPAEALAATGYLTAAEAGGRADALRLASDRALIREIARRIDANAAAWAGTFDEVVDGATAEIRPACDTAPPRLAVADSSPDEPEDGTDFD